ncbi:MAG: bifunctional diguanylate cyclase/phosphodiesterase [Pseudomonadales bacterium]
MDLKANARQLLRYQVLGMMAILILLIIGVFGYFLLHDSMLYNSKLVNLREQVQQQQREQLRTELNAAKEYIAHMESAAQSELKLQSKAQVEQAHTIASALYEQNRDSKSDAQILHLIAETLRPLRFFSDRGYFFINRMDGTNLLLPPNPALEGVNLYDFQDDAGNYTTRNIIKSVQGSQGAGYSRYRWKSPTAKAEFNDKITYAKYFAPLDILIGTGDYVYSFEQDLRTKALERLSLIHFGDSGSISVLDTQGNLLLSPYYDQPQSLAQLEPANRRTNYTQLLDFAASGGGFLQLNWQSPLAGKMIEKLSLVETLPELNWVIISDANQESFQRLFQRQRESAEDTARQELLILFFALLITALFASAMTVVYSRWFKKLFVHYQHNIQQQQLRLRANSQQLQIAARVFETASEGILVTNPQGEIIAVNPACCETTGYSEQELLGRNPSLLSSGQQGENFYQTMWQQINSTGQWKGELYNKRKSGEVYPEWLSISVSKDEQGQVTNYIATFSDVSARKEAERRLRYLADYDPLTELANRRLLSDRVEEAIGVCQRDPEQHLAILFIDLDRFKNINDSLGHSIGDKVLQSTAQRLLSTVRSADTVCRLGGDEFIILINHEKAMSAAARLSNRIIKALADPLQVDNFDLVVTPSIGIATYPQNGEDFDTLLKNADAALYHAKSQGRNNFQFFTQDMNLKASQKLSIEQGLREALLHSQFEVHYQGQYSLDSNELCGLEALLRWKSPTQGYIPPDIFIPIAEETGIILPLGQWVLEEVCAQAMRWQAAGFIPVPVAVNVSSHQFNELLVDSVCEVLARTGLDPQWLVLEITESALMKNPVLSTKALESLQQHGIKIALDDFGTGYSSLAYLKQFPIDKLKIDRAFIDGLPDDQDDLAITRSILDVARNLNMLTIAEGVETDNQYDFLRQAGCQQMQGYYKAKPLPIDALERQVLQRTLAEPLRAQAMPA